MSFTYIDSLNQEQDPSSATSLARVLDWTWTAHSLAVALVTFEDSTGLVAVSNIGDTYNGASSWTFGGTARHTTDTQRTEVWIKSDIAAGANATVTANFNASCAFRAMCVAEYSTGSLAVSVDKTTSAQADTGTAVDSGSQTTTADGELIIGALYRHGPATITNLNGFSQREQNTGFDLGLFDKVQGSAGSVNFAVTLSANDFWSALMVTLKLVGGASTPVVDEPQSNLLRPFNMGFGRR